MACCHPLRPCLAWHWPWYLCISLFKCGADAPLRLRRGSPRTYAGIMAELLAFAGSATPRGKATDPCLALRELPATVGEDEHGLGNVANGVALQEMRPHRRGNL